MNIIKINAAMLAVAFLFCSTQSAHSQFQGPGGNDVSRGQCRRIDPVYPGTGANLQNCQGAVITGGSYENYSIQNALGNGLDIEGTLSLVGNPHIFGASGDGIVIHGNNNWTGDAVGNPIVFNANNGLVIIGNGCNVTGGLIEGCRGAGILIIGNKNTVLNVTIKNCKQPVVIRGTGNQVSWAPGPTLGLFGL